MISRRGFVLVQNVRSGRHRSNVQQLSSVHGGENPRGTRARWGSRFLWTYGQPVPHRDKKALQKRRQKLGVSAGDISGLKLSRRSKHVLPAWFCATLSDRLDGWMVGRSAR